MLSFPDPQNPMESSLFQAEQNPPRPKPDYPAFFFPFSPSSLDSENLPDILSTHLILPFAASMADAPQQPPPSSLSPNVNSMATTTPPTKSRKVVRKDRHSKIFTATGPRDRRMRLSLQVARRFFDLQDMLGFDKASKTVQWLLTMSEAAIKKLAAACRPRDHAFGDESPKNESSTSECVDISTVSDHKGKSSQVAVAVTSGEAKKPRAKKAAARPYAKPAFRPKIARETRAKARERARERTREKKRTSSATLRDGGDQWASLSLPLDTIEEESGRRDLKSSLDLGAQLEERCSSMPNQPVRYVNVRALEVPSESGSVPISVTDYGNIVSINDTVSIFQEQWDILNG